MRALIQRVSHASVTIGDEIKGSIKRGLLLFVGIGHDDEEKDMIWLVSKILSMRIFEDDQGKMNLSVKDIEGDILLISQFTLYGSTKKGNRPSFNGSAKPEKAVPLYNRFHILLEEELKKTVPSGEFGAQMEINLCNDGPVTIIIDSRERY
ncbi:MAG: D-tyrosyl-tRNA(Tyr) deacylase [Spirochaetaceae bacterium]|nr:D-tyrosyl-tRNA(Tyr) deacylase [Spirochaetaceae bacterium]